MTSLLMGFVFRHLIVIASVATIGVSVLLIYSNWKHKIQEEGARHFVEKVQEQNAQATRAASRAADNSGRPARVRNSGWCGEGYRCPGGN